MTVSDTVNYDIHRAENSTLKSSSDCIAIEEPLEISIRYYKSSEWLLEPLMVTMRTPGNDEDLLTGLLFSEGVIRDTSEIEKISVKGNNEGNYDIDNSLVVTLKKGSQLDLKNLQRHFMVNSSCGVCGKGSLNAIEIAYEPNIERMKPMVSVDLITKLPEILRAKQQQFADTGGVHASALFSADGELIHMAEDVGRHNALDKLIGHALKNKIIKPENQFIACSGRLNFELVQKALMSNIGLMAGVGAPTSLAIDLAKRFDMTLVGFVKSDSFNIYCNKNRILFKN